MKKHMNKGWRKAGAAAAAALLALQMAFVPAMAADAAAESVTADVTLSGNMNGTDIAAELKLVVDPAAKAQSLAGTVNVSGMGLELAEYADTEGILLKLPMVEKVLSYNFSSDPSGSFLASVIGEDKLSQIKDAIASLSGNAGSSLPDTDAIAGQISGIITEAFGSLELTPAEAKDCQVGGETVSCQGTHLDLSGAFLQDLAGKILAVEVAEGKTIGDVAEQIASMSDTAPDINSFVAQLGEVENLGVDIYVNESYPAEIDLTSPTGSVLSIQLRGPAEMPYSDVVVSVDGTEMASLKATVDGTGVSVVLTAQGSEVVSFKVDTQNGTYELNAQGLPSPISGTYSLTEQGIALTADFMGFSVGVTAYSGGTVEKPEGEILELTTASQEEVMEALGALASMFGGSSASYDAAA